MISGSGGLVRVSHGTIVTSDHKICFFGQGIVTTLTGSRIFGSRVVIKVFKGVRLVRGRSRTMGRKVAKTSGVPIIG